MYLTRELIEPNQFYRANEECESGAQVLFFGTVRRLNAGREVIYLEYEAYEKMAVQMIREEVERSFQKWSLTKIKILHRLGRVGLGEIAVAIHVASAHRDEAYQASSHLIEEIKYRIPIWKKEYFADGASVWSLCQREHAHA